MQVITAHMANAAPSTAGTYAYFEETHWSVVLAAGDAAAEPGDEAWDHRTKKRERTQIPGKVPPDFLLYRCGDHVCRTKMLGLWRGDSARLGGWGRRIGPPLYARAKKASPSAQK